MSDYSFKITVYVTRRPNMLEENLEYVLYMGTGVLRDLYLHEKVNTVKKLALYYPERWLNIVQERCLYDRLSKYCPHLESVEIVTQSVYIMQCTASKNIRIISSPAEIAYTESHGQLPQECATGVTAFDPPLNLDFSKINVYSSSV